VGTNIFEKNAASIFRIKVSSVRLCLGYVVRGDGTELSVGKIYNFLGAVVLLSLEGHGIVS
jgi:hypothetical protein